MSFILSGNNHTLIIINVSPIVFLGLWLETISYFERRFQSDVSYWTLGGSTTGSFEGLINPKDISLLS
jgi:hypothetical protein